MNAKAKQRALVNFITKHYSNAQITDLYFATGIDIENVGVSQAGKSAKVRELVLYAARRSEEYDGKHRSYMYPLLEAINNDDEIPDTDMSQFAWLDWPYPGSPLETPSPTPSVKPETTPSSRTPTETHQPATGASNQGSYINFDISIAAKRGENYPVSVSSIVGDTEQPILQPFPPEDADFDDTLYYLRELMASKQDAEQLGRTLQTFLFPKKIQSLFDSARTQAKTEGKKGVRIRLKITNDIPEIARIPWEYCWDKRSFMALDDATPIVRYTPVAVPIKKSKTPEKVRILLVTASPEDHLPIINLEEQENRVREGLSDLIADNRVELRVLSHATKRDLRLNFRKFKPHILHFVGHGMLEGNEGMLLLENRDKTSSKVSANDMYVLTQTSDVKMVMLSACETAAQSEDSSEAIMGVAPILVAAGVPAVVAMQFEIPEKTAVSFTRDMYEFLADGEPLDAAITEARIGIFFDGDGPDSKLYWAIPVLFMRSPDGRIW